MNDKIALVTGGNRGLGYGTCEALVKRGYEVILTSRSESKGAEAAARLKAHFRVLDSSNSQSIQDVAESIKKEFGRLDVLVNNAGIFMSRGSVWGTPFEELQSTIATNTVGPYLMCQQFIPLMKPNNYGRVVNVSSGLGQLSEMGGGNGSYRVSKTALNAVTRIFAAETEGTNILVNSVCPGWVRTDMGGASATRSLEQGVSGIVWAATLENDGPTGGFFRDGKPIDW